jgi:hypothetical protein
MPAFGTFLPFVALQHHGGYRGHRRHFADGAGRPSLTHLCHLMINFAVMHSSALMQRCGTVRPLV